MNITKNRMKKGNAMTLNGVIKIFSVVLSFLSVYSCTPKDTKNNYDKIPFLHQSKGTKNYEITKIADWGTVKWDSIDKLFLIETDKKYFKYSNKGKFIDSINNEFVQILDSDRSFPDEINFYTSWLNDGNKKLKRYIDILPYQIEKRDTTLYKQKHLDFYKKSAFVKYSNYGFYYYYYYYYYNNNWYRMTGWGDRWIKKNYPEKLPPTRLLNIASNPNPPNNVKQLYIPRKKVKLTSDAIGAPKNFTLGTYIVRVGLPGGDSLIYRRFGDRLGNLTKFYQLPGSKGGNDSILFISQEYNNQDGYFSHGGLFMIKPKKKK